MTKRWTIGIILFAILITLAILQHNIYCREFTLYAYLILVFILFYFIVLPRILKPKYYQPTVAEVKPTVKGTEEIVTKKATVVDVILTKAKEKIVVILYNLREMFNPIRRARILKALLNEKITLKDIDKFLGAEDARLKTVDEIIQREDSQLAQLKEKLVVKKVKFSKGLSLIKKIAVDTVTDTSTEIIIFYTEARDVIKRFLEKKTLREIDRSLQKDDQRLRKIDQRLALEDENISFYDRLMRILFRRKPPQVLINLKTINDLLRKEDRRLRELDMGLESIDHTLETEKKILQEQLQKEWSQRRLTQKTKQELLKEYTEKLRALQHRLEAETKRVKAVEELEKIKNIKRKPKGIIYLIKRFIRKQKETKEKIWKEKERLKQKETAFERSLDRLNTQITQRDREITDTNKKLDKDDDALTEKFSDVRLQTLNQKLKEIYEAQRHDRQFTQQKQKEFDGQRKRIQAYVEKKQQEIKDVRRQEELRLKNKEQKKKRREERRKRFQRFISELKNVFKPKKPNTLDILNRKISHNGKTLRETNHRLTRDNSKLHSDTQFVRQYNQWISTLKKKSVILERTYQEKERQQQLLNVRRKQMEKNYEKELAEVYDRRIRQEFERSKQEKRLQNKPKTQKRQRKRYLKDVLRLFNHYLKRPKKQKIKKDLDTINHTLDENNKKLRRLP